jgi:hypothetical protein
MSRCLKRAWCGLAIGANGDACRIARSAVWRVTFAYVSRRSRCSQADDSVGRTSRALVVCADENQVTPRRVDRPAL